MGKVTVDIYSKEYEFKKLNLSDENVVKYLILFRSQVDILSGISTNPDINQAGDLFELNQELISLYASLDNLIDRIDWHEDERKFLDLIFDGYSISRIVEDGFFKKSKSYRMRDNVIRKICEKDYDDWTEWTTKYVNKEC